MYEQEKSACVCKQEQSACVCESVCVHVCVNRSRVHVCEDRSTFAVYKCFNDLKDMCLLPVLCEEQGHKSGSQNHANNHAHEPNHTHTHTRTHTHTPSHTLTYSHTHLPKRVLPHHRSPLLHTPGWPKQQHRHGQHAQPWLAGWPKQQHHQRHQGWFAGWRACSRVHDAAGAAPSIAAGHTALLAAAAAAAAGVGADPLSAYMQDAAAPVDCAHTAGAEGS